MRHIGFGVIGIGRQGLRLAEHIRKDIRHGKLVAVCRRSESGREYSKTHGIRFYRNYRDLLNDRDVDAIIITTPSSLHGVQALDALKSGKHILVDKPIASNVREGEQIIRLSASKNLTVAVNFPLRVNPVTGALKNGLKEIGKLRKIHAVVSHGPVRSKWQTDLKLSGGGVILDLGSHYFDLVSFLTGCQPEAVINAYSEETENEHSSIVDLDYKHFSASVVMIRNQKLKKNLITCAGENGFVFADYALREVIVSNSHEVREIKCPSNFDFEGILTNLVRVINKQEEVIADAEAGLNSLKTTLSVYEAIRSQNTVKPAKH